MPTQTAPAFQVNDYIFHGGSGVCIVEDICVPKHMHGADAKRKYYRLHPIYEAGSVIYTPVDHAQTFVRPILTRREAEQLIRQLPDIEPLHIPNEKLKESQYRELLRTNRCDAWLQLIKTLYLRTQARKNDGKRPCQSDEKYLQLAERLLYGELAIPLGIPKEQVCDYIAEHVAALQKTPQ